MITIKQTKQIREQLELTHIIIFGLSSEGMQHVASHGKTKAQAVEAAEFANKLKKGLKWPNELCNTKPLNRICKNCAYWDEEKNPSVNYPERKDLPGWCGYNPTEIKRFDTAVACHHFEPNC